MFRYTNDGQGNRSLKEVSTASRQARYPAFAGTVSVAAADFDGKGKDELLVGLSQWLGFDDGTYEQSKDADVWQADSNLNLTQWVTLRTRRRLQ